MSGNPYHDRRGRFTSGDGDVYDNRPYQSGLYSSGNKFAVIVDNPRK